MKRIGELEEKKDYEEEEEKKEKKKQRGEKEKMKKTKEEEETEWISVEEQLQWEIWIIVIFFTAIFTLSFNKQWFIFNMLIKKEKLNRVYEKEDE